MENKNDWEEIEKWNAERIEKQKEKFGSYQEGFTKNKGIDNFVKGLNITGKVFKVIKYIVISIIIIIIISALSMSISNLQSKFTVDVYKNIENKYKVKVNTLYTDINEKEDGTYKFEVKGNENIKFTAIKKGNQLTEDLSDNSHKYYFDLWNSQNKKNFQIVEKYNNEFLEYHTYIEIDNEEELKEAMKIMNEFIEFCKKDSYYLTWDIYLKKGEYRIYPYEQSGISGETATNKALDTYRNYFN